MRSCSTSSSRATWARKHINSPPSHTHTHAHTTALVLRWSDYEVVFHFPEPTDLGNNSLMQLIDADFKYPGEWLLFEYTCDVMHSVCQSLAVPQSSLMNVAC